MNQIHQREIIVYKTVEITLSYKHKEDSPLSIPPRIWYWQTESDRGFDKKKDKAIALAQKSIDKIRMKIPT